MYVHVYSRYLLVLFMAIYHILWQTIIDKMPYAPQVPKISYTFCDNYTHLYTCLRRRGVLCRLPGKHVLDQSTDHAANNAILLYCQDASQVQSSWFGWDKPPYSHRVKMLTTLWFRWIPLCLQLSSTHECMMTASLCALCAYIALQK